jgi:flagellar basal-body rod modification protein FlgD
MMDVTGINNVMGATQGTERSPSGVLGKDDFLKLLTVQLEHQDPLSPMENQDLIGQLAQFSSLEQLENINANLQSSMNLDLILTQVLNNTAAAGLIGKTVVAEGGRVSLDSSDSAQIHFDLEADAERVTVEILDDGGVVIRTIERQGLTAGRHEIVWDGKDDEGRDRADGTYQVRTRAFGPDGEEVDSAPLVVGKIAGVKFKNGEAILIAGDVEIGISEIIEILGEDSK